jgi:hypothetical protein
MREPEQEPTPVEEVRGRWAGPRITGGGTTHPGIDIPLLRQL